MTITANTRCASGTGKRRPSATGISMPSFLCLLAALAFFAGCASETTNRNGAGPISILSETPADIDTEPESENTETLWDTYDSTMRNEAKKIVEAIDGKSAEGETTIGVASYLEPGDGKIVHPVQIDRRSNKIGAEVQEHLIRYAREHGFSHLTFVIGGLNDLRLAQMYELIVEGNREFFEIRKQRFGKFKDAKYILCASVAESRERESYLNVRVRVFETIYGEIIYSNDFQAKDMDGL